MNSTERKDLKKISRRYIVFNKDLNLYWAIRGRTSVASEAEKYTKKEIDERSLWINPTYKVVEIE